jgi:hypothetical protein
MNLKACFFDAFTSRPRPLDTQILQPYVRYGGDSLRDLLVAKTSTELSTYDIRTEVEGNLWMLAPQAFCYFLPAFMHASLESYESLSIFVSELVSALTEPSRADVVEALDRAALIPHGLGLADDTMEKLRKQQLELFDSGIPFAIFHERVDGMTAAESAAVFFFFDALQAAHGEDFPLGELASAVDRYWIRFRASSMGCNI